jgi:hypothetical protein
MGNIAHGGGSDPAVVVEAPGDVVMTGNRCTQPPDARTTTVALTGGTTVVQANRIHGGVPSMTIAANSAVVLGNITSGGIQLNGTAIPADATNPKG